MQPELTSPPLSNPVEPVLSYSYRRSDREVFSLCSHRRKLSGNTIDEHFRFDLQLALEEHVFIHGKQGSVLVYGRLELFPEPGPRFHISRKEFRFYWGATSLSG